MAFFNKRYHPPGTSPGTLTQVATATVAPPRIRLVDFKQSEVEIREQVDINDCRPYLEDEFPTWIHVQGQPDEALLRSMGESFALHALALEDVFNTGQRPKVETYDDQLFVVLSMPLMHHDLVETHQISLFLSNNTLISFCAGEFDPFQPIIKRLSDKGSRLRTKGIDFLFYTLIDLVIDQAFPVLESFGMQLEEVEQQVLESAGRETLQKIYVLKRELILLRRMLWPQREVINQLLREDFPLLQQGTEVYLRDCYDHTIQVMDLLETYRDMTSSLLDIYLSSVSNRMNEVMRVLTVIATIFIPLTFIVGVYGMNFDRGSSWNMPELGWPYGYLLVWVVMLSIVALMLVLFRRRGWF